VGTLPERIAYYRDVFRADYLITSDEESADAPRLFLRELSFVKLGGRRGLSEPTGLQKRVLALAEKFGFKPFGADPRDGGYRGVVYGRPGTVARPSGSHPPLPPPSIDVQLERDPPTRHRAPQAR
jgi:N-formylglutamate amidohydrolase